VASVRDAIQAVGASILYLPPYSSDLDSIEQSYFEFKALLRKTDARTRDPLWTVIAQPLDAHEPFECRRYLRNCGYAFGSGKTALVTEAMTIPIPVDRAIITGNADCFV
jgi:hypothetical protein